MRRLLLRHFLRPWWRVSRGLTLGVRAVILDEAGRVLLVRHTYVAGWHLPGGGVERGETLLTALGRELVEEAGVVLDAPPTLHGIFSNEEEFPGDHVAVFVTEAWRQVAAGRRRIEIRETGFFDPEDLPEGTNAGTGRRLREILHGAPATEFW